MTDRLLARLLRTASAWFVLMATSLSLVAALAIAPASAQTAPPPPEERSSPETEDETERAFGPEIPRGAVREYLEACRAGDFERAASFLDLSWLGPEARRDAGPVLARHLKVVLDRKLWVDLDAVSGEPEGDPDDRLPVGVDRLGIVQSEKGDVEILIKRIEVDEGAHVWKFSRATARRIEDLYGQYGYGALGDLLPQWMFVGRFFEIEVWQWFGLLVLALLACVVGIVVVWILTRIIRPIAARTDTTLDDELLRLAAVPARFIVALAAFAAGTFVLKLSVPAQQFLNGLEKGLAILLVTWIVMRAVNILEDVVKTRLEKQERTALIAALPLGRRSIKVALLLLATIALLQNLGFNVTGLLAGLGVGGLAVALAAQKTVENLFGGVAVTVDQPVRVGDFCKFGDKIGTVEDIGLRSTRIRTLDRTVVTVPNAEFSQIQIENFAKRDRMRLYVVLGLRYETTPDQLRHVIKGIRELLVAHPRVLAEPLRARFASFGAYSLDVEVFAYVDTQDFNEFVAIREDIYLRMMDVVATSGTGFAFPSQTLYLGRDTGLDVDRSRTAEAEVRAWREASRLPFPDFDPETADAVRDTLDYPPRGSAVAGRTT